VDELNAQLAALENLLPAGNILPQPANRNLKSLLVDNDLGIDAAAHGPAPRVLLDPAQSALQSTAAPAFSSAPGAESGEELMVPTGSLKSQDFHALRQSELQGQIEKVGQHGFEKAAIDAAGIGKGEWAAAQAAVRGQSEADKLQALVLERTVADPEWKQELGDRITWMTRNSLAAAELKVNPPQMGPVEVRINLNQDQMNIVFASQNAAVREALEAAIPRLRDMLGAQQLNLTHVDISHSFADQSHQQAGRDGAGPHRGALLHSPLLGAEESLPEGSESTQNVSNLGLLNYYV
jgi:flagellar hook-length control protein FliK